MPSAARLSLLGVTYEVQPSFLLKVQHGCKCGCPYFSRLWTADDGFIILHAHIIKAYVNTWATNSSPVRMQREQQVQSYEVNHNKPMICDSHIPFYNVCKELQRSICGRCVLFARQTGEWTAYVCTSRIFLCKGCSFKTHCIKIGVQKGSKRCALVPPILCTTVQSSWDRRLEQEHQRYYYDQTPVLSQFFIPI